MRNRSFRGAPSFSDRPVRRSTEGEGDDCNTRVKELDGKAELPDPERLHSCCSATPITAHSVSKYAPIIGDVSQTRYEITPMINGYFQTLCVFALLS
jgi:hypothetical protein